MSSKKPKKTPKAPKEPGEPKAFKPCKCGCRRREGMPGVIRNSDGRLVSAARSAASKNSSWVRAVRDARADLGVTGFVPIKKGSALYERAKALQR